MSTVWTTVASSAANILTNSWDLGANWSQSGSDLTHTPGLDEQAFQFVTYDFTKTYYFRVTVGGSVGSISVIFGDTNVVGPIAAGTTTIVSAVPEVAIDSIFVISPSTDYDGTVSNMALAAGQPTTWNAIASPFLPSWSTVSKASGTSYTTIPAPTGAVTTQYGAAYGLLLAITRPVNVVTDAWTQIADPSTNWNVIPKAT